MDIASIDQEKISLLPGNLTIEQSKDMTLFTITRAVLQKSEHPRTGIQMKITMKRKIMSEMMTTYFPTLLLMMITYATTYFKPFFFEAALSVNLTTMLMMTTIFMSKMEGLPPTSSTKMIDYWLILCQLVPFAEVMLLTALEYIKEEEFEKGLKVNEEDEDLKQEEEQEPKAKKAWTSQAKLPNVNYVPVVIFIGMPKFLYFTLNNLPCSAEKKVVPLAVLISFVAYFGFAAKFYFE